MVGAHRAHRERRSLSQRVRWLFAVPAKVLGVLRRPVAVDVPLAVVCAMLSTGAAFFMLGLVNHWLRLFEARPWMFWVVGLLDWVVAAGTFFSFLNGPLPKHRMVR